eukprot:33564_1
MDAKVAEMSDVAEITPDLTDDNAILAQAEIVKAEFEAKLSKVDIAIKKNLAEIAIIDSKIEDLNGNFYAKLSDLESAQNNAEITTLQREKSEIVEKMSKQRIKLAEINEEEEKAV